MINPEPPRSVSSNEDDIVKALLAAGLIGVFIAAHSTFAAEVAGCMAETGAGGANLTVDSDDLSLFEIGVGVDVSWLSKNSDGSYLKPGINLGVRHDLIGDEFEATNTFAGGGAAFKTEGFDPAQTTFDVGGSFRFICAIYILLHYLWKIRITINLIVQFKTLFIAG